MLHFNAVVWFFQLCSVKGKCICMYKQNVFIAFYVNFVDLIQAMNTHMEGDLFPKWEQSLLNIFLSVCIFIPRSSLLCLVSLPVYPASLTTYLRES